MGGPATSQMSPMNKRSPKGKHAHMTMTDIQADFEIPAMQSDVTFFSSSDSMKKKISDGIATASMDQLAHQWDVNGGKANAGRKVSVADVMNAQHDSLEMMMFSEELDSGGAPFE